MPLALDRARRNLRRIPTTRINIVENWFAEVDRLVPTGSAGK